MAEPRACPGSRLRGYCGLCLPSGRPCHVRFAAVAGITNGAQRDREWFAEMVATFGLLLTIFGYLPRTQTAVPYAVGLYITAAYWFTASPSFANPAVIRTRSPE